MKKISNLISLSFLLTVVTINFVFAHERQVINVGGVDYLFIIGSLNEPVVVGDKTGLDLKIALADKKDYSTTTSKAVIPILDLEKTLKVQNITESGYLKDFDIAAAWGKPGNYTTLFYPTSSNIFSYRIYGKIKDTEIDLKFTCNSKGHVMQEMKHDANNKMQNGNFEIKYMSGSFGCPKEKEDFLFPSNYDFNFIKLFTNFIKNL